MCFKSNESWEAQREDIVSSSRGVAEGSGPAPAPARERRGRVGGATKDGRTYRMPPIRVSSVPPCLERRLEGSLLLVLASSYS